MSELPMRGHFRYLRFKTFSTTPRTPQCEVFCPFLSSSKHSGVPEDSKTQLFQVLGFTPTLGQSRGATFYSHISLGLTMPNTILISGFPIWMKRRAAPLTTKFKGNSFRTLEVVDMIGILFKILCHIMESWKRSWWYLMMHIQSLKSMCLSASGLK